MKRQPARCPGDFVRARLPDERLSALWTGIERAEAALNGRRTRQRRVAKAALVLAGACAGLLCVRAAVHSELGSELLSSVSGEHPSPAPVPAPGAAPANERQLSLADGSTLTLERETRAHVVRMTSSEVRVRLEHGSVECEVAPVPERTFVVEAGGFEVVVRGTHFSVNLDTGPATQNQVRVDVTRGLVEIRRAPDQVIARLGAGQTLRLQRESWAADSPAFVIGAPAELRAPAAAAAAGSVSPTFTSDDRRP